MTFFFPAEQHSLPFCCVCGLLLLLLPLEKIFAMLLQLRMLFGSTCRITANFTKQKQELGTVTKFGKNVCSFELKPGLSSWKFFALIQILKWSAAFVEAVGSLVINWHESAMIVLQGAESQSLRARL